MAFFTVFQERLFTTAETPKGERAKIDKFLQLLEDFGVEKNTSKNPMIRYFV